MRALRGVALAVGGTVSLFAALFWMELEEFWQYRMRQLTRIRAMIRRMLRALR